MKEVKRATIPLEMRVADTVHKLVEYKLIVFGSIYTI